MSNEHEKGTVLLADNDPDILELARFRIEQAGYDVITARDGEHALRLIVDCEPDIVILDVTMPKLTGHEVTRQVRLHERVARTPVIILSGSVKQSDIGLSLEAGANDHIEKPFSPTKLLERVKALLAEHRAANRSQQPDGRDR
jgi:DNA-binding response OmpR family regulator